MGRNKQAVDIMDATECRYMVALEKLRSLDGRDRIDYMEAIDKILERIDNGENDACERCVHCLAPGHTCDGSECDK